MKVFGKIMKVLAALAMVAGAIYLLATYGDKICAWARKILNKFNCCCCVGEEIIAEAPAEEVVTEEETVQEEVVQADEQDFEG